ncbi:WXG100 family type VII secretion target [Streptomyces litmocidini]|uniref:WXG100 family type VII secretion target n=1 Tax=Streptomyces litmocidini TaxID=67318 RepID=A0ABW7UFM6_9ACTN
MRHEEGGRGGATNFAAMDHGQMVAWLDEASHAQVNEASGRLKSVADQMATIAEDLRASMRNMDWEGEAEKAFVEWATDVANSTTRLSEYSDRGSKLMADNAVAIASAQSAMPRSLPKPGAKDELNPAAADAFAKKQQETKAAAADEMYRLSGTYAWSSAQMRGEQPPTFPPPPGAFVPKSNDPRDSTEYIGSSPQSSDRSTGTDTSTGTHTTRSQSDTHSTTDTTTTSPTGDTTRPTHVIKPEVRPDAPVDLGIDSTDTLPKPTAPGPQTPTPGGPPPITKPDGGTPPFMTTGVPPLTVKGGPGPFGPTSPLTGGTGNPRNPVTGGLRNTPGMPREGISGGRQVPSTTGRPQTGIPRSTVIGNEPTGQNRTGMGRGMSGAHGMGGSMGGASGQNGITGGRRLAGETGGVVGGKAQRAGAAGGGKPFTAGGSGLVRGSTAKPGEREEQNGERPDYLVEDEETWQQGRRVAPPVID